MSRICYDIGPSKTSNAAVTLIGCYCTNSSSVPEIYRVFHRVKQIQKSFIKKFPPTHFITHFVVLNVITDMMKVVDCRYIQNQ